MAQAIVGSFAISRIFFHARPASGRCRPHRQPSRFHAQDGCSRNNTSLTCSNFAESIGCRRQDRGPLCILMLRKREVVMHEPHFSLHFVVFFNTLQRAFGEPLARRALWQSLNRSIRTFAITGPGARPDLACAEGAAEPLIAMAENRTSSSGRRGFFASVTPTQA